MIDSSTGVTIDELCAILGANAIDDDNCYHCNNPLEDGECVFCSTTRAIENTFTCFYTPGQIVELRVLRTSRPTLSGLYTDHTRLIDDIRFLNADPSVKGIYTTMNPIKAEVLANGDMAVNGYRTATRTTKDSDISRIEHLFIDFDPVRPSNTSATDEEVVAADEAMIQVAGYLHTKGWPRPHFCESGNGMHLRYPLDLENTAVNSSWVALALRGLSERFSTDAVNVDTQVGNPARICKVYGTIARKGPNDGGRPWRNSRIANYRLARNVEVTLQQLKAEAQDEPRVTKSTDKPTLDPDFDVYDLIDHFELELVGEEEKNGNRYLYLGQCPSAGRTHSGDPKKTALVVGSSLGFKCFSDDCADFHIGDLLRNLGEEFGRYPGLIWAEKDVSQYDWVETPVEQVAGKVAVVPTEKVAVPSVPVSTPSPMKLNLASEFEYEIPNEFLPVTCFSEDDEPYQSPNNRDNSKYPFPSEALYGWLGQKTLELDSPMGWAYPAMLTVWAGNGVNTHESMPNPRPTLYTVLLAAPGVGKSVTMTRAQKTLPPEFAHLRKTTVPGSDRGLFKMFQRPKGHPDADPDFPDTFLLVQDEFKNTLSKISIQGSSLASTLCTLYYENSAGSSDKTGSHEMSAKLNILAALPVEDESQFSEYFGSETTSGLYTRFVYGVGPSQWEWDFTWKPNPEMRTPSAVYVPRAIHKMRQDWINEGRGSGKVRGRLAEIALRIAVISASANQDESVTPECWLAALAFAKWQESITEQHKAGVAENLDGKVTSAILDTFEGLRKDGVSHWVKFWPVARNKNWAKKFGSSVVTRTRNSLVEEGLLLEERMEPEDGDDRKKGTKTGFVRLPNPDGAHLPASGVAVKKVGPKTKKGLRI